ncbi:MAG: hypothetical protein M1819_003384 [Sarea resinae]|nr:MAG: hypothetical protein M1819_003384 [Sarea resinae]
MAFSLSPDVESGINIDTTNDRTPTKTAAMEDLATVRGLSKESPDKAYLKGHPSLSAFLASDPDLQVYRRFDRLAARNLLYLQSEILELEAALDECDARDCDDVVRHRNLDVMQAAQCWEAFARKARSGDSARDAERMELVLRLRPLLKEYQEALLRQSAVLNLEHPSRRVRHAITQSFEHAQPLIGYSRDLYDEAADLVALRTTPDQDRLTVFMQDHLGYFFRDRRRGSRSLGELYYFPEKLMHRIVSTVSVILSAILLVGAICGLYYVRHEGARLGMIAAFTVVFAGTLSILTNARRAEVFGATAAYAAVLVVFVSGSLGS